LSNDLQLTYEAGQDRLVLTMSGAVGVRRFWLTRRQCTALVLACSEAEGEPPPLKVAPASAVAREQQPGTTGAATQGEAEADVEPAGPSLMRLSLRRLPDGLRLSLAAVAAADLRPVHLLLKPVDQLSLLRTLRFLATKAQWDLDVAESRAAANALIRKMRVN
jgi:hypothetical protein